MVQYPIGIITENLYTTGKEFFLNSTPYIGYYHQISNKYYTEKIHTDNSKQLTPLADYLNKQTFKKEYNSKKAYFIKKNNDDIVRNVGINEYNQYKNNPLYISIEVDTTNPIEIINANKILPGVSILISSKNTINNINNVFEF